MWVLCALVTFVCTYIVEQTFHNNYLTIGLGAVMGISSGFLCAADARRQQEWNDQEGS